MKDASTVLISIITVVYNGVETIEKTINSVAGKLNDCIEYLIIDGGSKDATVDVIRKYSSKLAYWVSESDKGIYDAMNKGIRKASGKYVYFINCGDILLDLPVHILAACDASMACFPVKTDISVRYPSLGFTFFLTNTLPHQGIFYRRKNNLFFDTRYQVFADYALNVDVYKKDKNIELFKAPEVAYHSLDGISHNRKKFKEFFNVVKQKSGIHFMVMSYLYFKWQGIKNRLQL